MNPVVSRRVTFKDPYAKANWLAGQARMDALLRPVLHMAQRRFLQPSAAARALDVFRFVRDEIKYVRDPPPEQFADSAVVLERGFDDCDGKARVFAALLTAAEHLSPVGIEVQLQPVFPVPDAFSHVAARVRWPASQLFPRADRDGWVRAETILAGVPLGAGSECAHRGPDGKIVYA